MASSPSLFRFASLLALVCLSLCRIQTCLASGNEKHSLVLDLTHSFSGLPGSTGSGRGYMTLSHQKFIVRHDKRRAVVLHSRLIKKLLKQDPVKWSKRVKLAVSAPQPSSAPIAEELVNFKLVPSSSHASSPSPLSIQKKANGSTAGGANFMLDGDSEPYSSGLYWATIKLGTPSREFKVHIDSGSDILWVHCSPCISCPSTSSLITLALPYDSTQSSSSTSVTCASQICSAAQEYMGNSNLKCGLNSASECNYQVRYADGSSTSGNMLQDAFAFRSLNGTEVPSKVSFGCGRFQNGNLYDSEFVLDGLMGLAQGELSIPSQLVKQKLTTDSLAHCLSGEEMGGGRLIFGSVIDDSLTYTPMLGANLRTFYYVEITGIKVGSSPISGISSDSFGTPDDGGGVILDSGTTLSYFPSSVHTLWLNTILSIVSLPTSPNVETRTCWDIGSTGNSDLGKYFPNLTISFRGGDMNLSPLNYLFFRDFNFGRLACVGWDKSSSGFGTSLTVLGDSVLRNQLIVYDAANARVGWKPMDCSKASFSAIGNANDIPLTLSSIVSPSTASTSASALFNHFLLLPFCLFFLFFTL